MIGESANPKVVDGIKFLVSQKPGIERVNELLTMHLGPRDVLLNISLDFDDRLTAGRVEAVISELERSIKSAFPEVTRVFIEAQNWLAHEQSSRAQIEQNESPRTQDSHEV